MGGAEGGGNKERSQKHEDKRSIVYRTDLSIKVSNKHVGPHSGFPCGTIFFNNLKKKRKMVKFSVTLEQYNKYKYASSAIQYICII